MVVVPSAPVVVNLEVAVEEVGRAHERRLHVLSKRAATRDQHGRIEKQHAHRPQGHEARCNGGDPFVFVASEAARGAADALVTVQVLVREDA